MRTIENGYLGWNRGQWAAMKALPDDGPIQMINLIRLRERAIYPAEHPKAALGLSGWDAYRAYGRESAEAYQRVGGRQVWVGRPDLVAIGPEDEHWDIAFIAQYPDLEALRTMQLAPDYQMAVQNRTAAVLDSRLIRCAPLPLGTGFGEVAGS